MNPSTLRVGTSGWSYPHWAKGRFYPPGLKQGDWLAYYTRQFDTVEVNMTFYHLARPEMLERWRTASPEGFTFTLKLWRRITHERRLAECADDLRQFLEMAETLGSKRGPLLVQLPPSFRRDAERLDAFLGSIPEAAGGVTWRVAVEFRNPEWLCAPVYAVLEKHGAALCLADLPVCPVTEPVSAPFVYLRRHGPGWGYRGRYALEHIAADACRVRRWLDTGRDVYVYYNNDVDGWAVDNARELREAVGSGGI